MHGLAFAAVLGGLDLSRGSLVRELLGFKLGIELTQLIVVATVMPSLIPLSRTCAYPVVRIGLATAGVVLAGAWLAERTALISANPLEGVSTSLTAHPVMVVGSLALLAAVGINVPGWRASRRPHAEVQAGQRGRAGEQASSTQETPEDDACAGPIWVVSRRFLTGLDLPAGYARRSRAV